MSYLIKYLNDDSIYIGGNPQNSKWNNQPLKPIKRIEYKLLGKTAIFEGFEAYNHLIERGHFVLQGKEKLLNVYLMGLKNDKIFIFKFDLTTNEIIEQIKPKNKEYYGTATTGWKEGLKDQEIYTNLTE
jgi:hypothetical protein